MSEIFDDQHSFADLGLRRSVLKGLDAAGYQQPTRIQSELIPAILQGKDVLGQAKTGTGKTAGFGLPIIHRVDVKVPVQALVLAPTRELSGQLVAELSELARFTPVKVANVVGGESMQEQRKQLRGGAHIVVGTPGRIRDLHRRGELRYDRLQWVVLDEVDRMLDIGFRDDMRDILGRIKQDHETIFVSATINDEIEKLARRFARSDITRISPPARSVTVAEVAQKYIPVRPDVKKRALLHLLKQEKPALTVVFCRTKATVGELARLLKGEGIDAHEIHGDLGQGQRQKIMHRLRQGKLEVLVASDLVSRGLDVRNISHVINYDLPEDPDVYVHRIGRTARTGRSGIAWSLVTPDQGQLLTEIEKLINVQLEKLELPEFEPSVPSAGEPEPSQEESVPQDHFEAPVFSAGSNGDEARDPVKFPGGVAPKSSPRKTLGSPLRSRRNR